MLFDATIRKVDIINPEYMEEKTMKAVEKKSNHDRIDYKKGLAI